MHHKSNRLDGQSILVVTFNASHNVSAVGRYF
jgi:hypothetical protein